MRQIGNGECQNEAPSGGGQSTGDPTLGGGRSTSGSSTKTTISMISVRQERGPGAAPEWIAKRSAQRAGCPVVHHEKTKKKWGSSVVIGRRPAQLPNVPGQQEGGWCARLVVCLCRNATFSAVLNSSLVLSRVPTVKGHPAGDHTRQLPLCLVER